MTSSCGTHRTLCAIATSAAHASASAETNRMNLGATYWLMDAIATRVTHVGLTATHTTSMSGWCASGGHGATSPGTHDAPWRHSTSRGTYVDVRPETASAVTPSRSNAATPRSPERPVPVDRPPLPRARGSEGDARGGACDRPIGDIAARDATRATTQCGRRRWNFWEVQKRSRRHAKKVD